MLTINKTMNLSGISVVAEGEKQMQVARMSATINAGGEFNSNHSIQNKDMFEMHKEEVLKDFDDFDNCVYKNAEELNIKDREEA